jgi:hypothetical protein
VPRNVTIGFYGPLSLREGTDPAWIEAAAQAYRSDEAATRALLSGAHSLGAALSGAAPAAEHGTAGAGRASAAVGAMDRSEILG